MTTKRKTVIVTQDVSSAVSDAFSELACLGEELRSWYDNMPENFQNGDKGSQVSEAADALESLQEIDVPEVIQDLDASYEKLTRKSSSRSARRDDAVESLEYAKAVAEEWLGEEQNEKHDKRDDVESFVSELDDVISEASNVEFPGMY